MPPKRRASPLHEPPTVSSSEEEEKSSEEESLSEEDDGPSNSLKSIAQKPQPASKSLVSSSESETDSDSGSDSEDIRPTLAVDPVVKSTPKAKKTKSQLRSAKKRSNGNNQAVSDSERAKKKGKEVAGVDETLASKNDGKKALEEPKKLFQRLWSEDDEIAILEGMTTFLAKIGPDPYKEISSFHDLIKKSLHTDVSNEQLLNKIRKMKQKYKKIAAKITTNGACPRLTKPHDIKAFELSKKIWGSEGENGGTEVIKGSNTGPSSKSKAEMNSKEARRQILTDDNDGSSLILSEMIGFNKNLGVSWLDEDAIRREVELIGASKRAELEDMWKKLQVAELDLFVKRADLIKDHATLIWEAYKSSK